MNKDIKSIGIIGYIIYILLILTPLCDTLNGMLIFYNINFSVSIVLKGIIIILLLLYLLMKKNILIILLTIFFILLLTIKHIVQDDNFSIELMWGVKIYFFMILFLFIKETVNNKISMIHLYFIALLLSIVFNILGGFVFGYGFVAYEDSEIK